MFDRKQRPRREPRGPRRTLWVGSWIVFDQNRHVGRGGSAMPIVHVNEEAVLPGCAENATSAFAPCDEITAPSMGPTGGS